MSSLGFNWIDYIFLAGLVIFALIGFKQGFVRSLMTLVVWLVAFLLATLFKDQATFLFTKVTAHSALQASMAFATIFIVVLLIGAVINYALSSMVENKGLGLLNRIVGLVFGFFCGVLIIAFVVYLLTLTPIQQYSAWKHAKLVPGFSQIAGAIKSKAPAHMPSIKSKDHSMTPANEQEHLNAIQGDHIRDQA